MESRQEGMHRGGFTLQLLKLIYKVYQPGQVIRRKAGKRDLEMTTGADGSVIEFVLGTADENGVVIGKNFKREEKDGLKHGTDQFPWVYREPVS